MEYQFNTDNFETEVLKSDLPVLVDFYADWCGPCKMMAPVVKALSEEFDGQIKVGKLNTDNSPEITSRYHIMSIPTFLIIKKGQVMDTVMGAVSKNELESKCRALL